MVAIALVAAWMFSVQLWAIAEIGHWDLEFVPVALLWPAVSILAVVELLPIRGARSSGRWVGLGIGVAAYGLLALNTVASVFGALKDGSVSPWGFVTGTAEVTLVGVLSWWLLLIVRGWRRDSRLQ